MNKNFPLDTAVKMYKEGQSVLSIANELGFGNWVVWSRLKKVVQMRDKTDKIVALPKWNKGKIKKVIFGNNEEIFNYLFSSKA